MPSDAERKLLRKHLLAFRALVNDRLNSPGVIAGIPHVGEWR
jgi:hypothetical protein